MNDPPPLLFTLSESRDLGEAISRESGVPLAPLEERAFEQGEFKLRPLLSVRERTAWVVQSLCGSNEAPTAQRLMRLLFLLCVLRDAGARRTVALVPYLAYARKDRRTQVRDPIHTRYVAQLFEACGIDRMVALDVHNPAALDNAFRVGFDHTAAVLDDSAVDGMVVTDSVGASSHPVLHSPPPKLTVLPIAPLLGQALSRLSHRLPLADLLEHWPPQMS